MKDIKQRISSEIYKVWDMTAGVDEVTAKIIEEIVKPLAKTAFTQGTLTHFDDRHHIFEAFWINETTGVTSNKQ